MQRPAKADLPPANALPSAGKEKDPPKLAKPSDPRSDQPILQLGIHPDYVVQEQTQLLFDTVGHFKTGYAIRHLDDTPFLTCKPHLLTDTQDVLAPDGRKIGTVGRHVGLMPGFAIKNAAGSAKAILKWYPPPYAGVHVRFKNILGDNEDVDLELFRHESSGKTHSIRVGGANGQIIAQYGRAEDGLGRVFTQQRKNTLINIEPGIDAALIVGIVVIYHLGRLNYA